MTDGRLREPSVRTFAQRAGRVALTVIGVLLISLLVLVGVLLFMSIPGPCRRPAFAEKLICLPANQRLGSFVSCESGNPETVSR